MSVLGSWLQDHPQDFWDPPAYPDLSSICTFLGWAAPGGPEAQEAEKLRRDFLEAAELKKDQQPLHQAWGGGEGLRYPWWSEQEFPRGFSTLQPFLSSFGGLQTKT